MTGKVIRFHEGLTVTEKLAPTGRRKRWQVRLTTPYFLRARRPTPPAVTERWTVRSPGAGAPQQKYCAAPAPRARRIIASELNQLLIPQTPGRFADWSSVG